MSCATATWCTSCSMSDAPGRISWLDGWRGAALYLMIVYHLLFDCVLFGWLPYGLLSTAPMVLFERVIAFSFILCAGVSATLSRSNVRHGLITLAAGGVVTAASFAVGAPIRFGVLQFLGLAMLIYAALERPLERVPERIAPALWGGLFIAARLVTDRVTVPVRWLFWLGLRYDGFVSFDYFPLLPFIFVFFLGVWMGRLARKRGDAFPLAGKTAPRWLTWPGRRSLAIYLAHQPILYGACLLVYLIA